MKLVYLGFAILGTILPWLFFVSYFAASGPDLPGFVRSVFANPPATGFTLDILLSIGVFLVWSYRDAGQLQVQNWWLVLPASFLVGLSLSLPLYLYLRHDAAERRLVQA